MSEPDVTRELWLRMRVPMNVVQDPVDHDPEAEVWKGRLNTVGVRIRHGKPVLGCEAAKAAWVMQIEYHRGPAELTLTIATDTFEGMMEAARDATWYVLHAVSRCSPSRY